ncbi:S1 RNA-binding domain-containing protein [Candidatus Arthromitus sp. SFB-turkey]|uniref:S1 RNA-binding domain-containing protein n=1 Tax=Candidatus Arthromitus sp. SFB-turkey TaxID=1840217 RepID=UPI0007F482C4|nr:S1 RNA-binding domain-containing protein [Candidatus Arthromitus sp. SFB-turkey]OAT89935.1 RNA-binding protein S1 [Candidatus Arthromitus sp. SFB-turkey]HJD00069.1 S1 RNA-binding domain-containing protein [Candidatus Dwaynia gallinarum]
MALVIGSIYDGKIVNVTNFGAFVDVNGEIGLVHISEVSNKYIKDIKEYLKDKKDVKVKVLSVDGNGKMSLSIKQAEDKFENNNKRSNDKKENDNVRSSKNNKLNFEDILSKYLKDSEERMQDFRKNQDSKQRGYGKRNFG